ncbi:hypothetical protein [Lacrimispora sp. JR3]|uniref:hypothetical protein n=1 Tax=Lacrimispora sinapis TaxID=3111456 RepID=UPI00374953A3
MDDQKKIFVTCEKVGSGSRVEAGGTFKDIVVLTTELLIEVGVSLSQEEVFDKMITPEDLIKAISATAIESASKRTKEDVLSH